MSTHTLETSAAYDFGTKAQPNLKFAWIRPSDGKIAWVTPKTSGTWATIIRTSQQRFAENRRNGQHRFDREGWRLMNDAEWAEYQNARKRNGGQWPGYFIMDNTAQLEQAAHLASKLEEQEEEIAKLRAQLEAAGEADKPARKAATKKEAGA